MCLVPNAQLRHRGTEGTEGTEIQNKCIVPSS